MKRITLFLLLFVPVISQDVIRTKDGQSLRGKVIIDDENKSVRLDKTSGGFTFLNFDNIKEIKNSDGEIIWSYEIYLSEIRAAQIKADCNKNKNIDVLLLPFVDDLYGLGSDSESALKNACYNIKSNFKALKFLDENKIQLSNINDYHLKRLGDDNSVDLVYFGYTYKMEVPYKNSPLVSQNPLNNLAALADDAFDFADGYLFKDIATSWIYGQELSEKRNAIASAGVYVVITYFSFDVKTGEKKFILKNSPVIKLG